MPHGATNIRSRIAHETAANDLVPAKLLRGGEVLPTKLILVNDDEVRTLATSCPKAMPAAVVGADPCFDRMAASVPFGDRYREALGAVPGQEVIFAVSSWSKYSLHGNDPQFFVRLTSELAGTGYHLVASLPPFWWDTYGHRQVLAWLGLHGNAAWSCCPRTRGGARPLSSPPSC